MNEDLPTVVDDTIEVGEATLATITLTTILKGEMPRIGIGKQKEILATDKRIDTLARQFVYDELPGKISLPRPFTYRKLLERFTKPISQLEIMEIKKKFPPDADDTALSFISTLQNAYAQLADELPVATFDTYLGPKNLLPTSDKLFDFWWTQYLMVDNPFAAFQLMQRGALIPPQVDTLKKFYPSLHNYMVAACLDALVKRNLNEKSFVNLPPRSDRGLATLKGQRVVEYGQNIHVTQPTDPKPAKVAPAKIDKGLQTPGQRADVI